MQFTTAMWRKFPAKIAIRFGNLLLRKAKTGRFIIFGILKRSFNDIF